jgi:hypothetical protein
MQERYILELHKDNVNLKIALSANDSGHAQAQAADIARALVSDSYNIAYGKQRETKLSRLFRDLANNNFDYKLCSLWNGSKVNNTPCVYALGKRHYIRNLIIRYLNIADDGHTAKPKCDCRDCINPYHFKHSKEKNEKISCGDLKMLVAYRGQGARVTQIAEAFNVHRSTIYRKLKNEPVLNGTQGHSNC